MNPHIAIIKLTLKKLLQKKMSLLVMGVFHGAFRIQGTIVIMKLNGTI